MIFPDVRTLTSLLAPGCEFVYWPSLQELIDALLDECEQSDIPSDYGGTSTTSLYDSKIETELREFVHKMG